VTAGTTYYIQVGTQGGIPGEVTIRLDAGLPPLNDDFVNATPVSGVPFSDPSNTEWAGTELAEPVPGCASGEVAKTIWYTFTPAQSTLISAHLDPSYSSVMAVYTGGSLADLDEVGCRTWGEWLTFHAEAGTTYYFQVGGMGGEGGALAFHLDPPPPPEVGFGFGPGNPTAFDIVWFWAWSWDPAGVGIESQAWDLGDGATAEGCCPSHQYSADGSYTVTLTVTTYDGRTASTSQVVPVQTHDVAITRFLVPQSATARQTRPVVVYVKNARYPEQVEVQLYKSVPGGYESVGSLRQFVPVRTGNRTSTFSFNYTFTADDARVGKVTFRAYAYLQNASDALPADNEAIAFPTKVTR
jgi:hypothetical protein